MARLYGPGPKDPPPLVSTHDLAGLRTVDVEDRPVGALVGALSEKQTGLIRYLDVELSGQGKHVLVPIGHARIDTHAMQPRVRLRAATFEDLMSVPDYPGETNGLHSDFHEQVLEVYGRLFYGDRYYAHPSFDHEALYAGENPIVEIGPSGTRDLPDTKHHPVQPLSRLQGIGMAQPDLDIRGHTLGDAAGDEVGEVVDLLVEPPAKRARYAVVQLDDPARRTVVPIGYIQPAEEDKRLVVRSLTREDILLLPACEGPLTREDENRIHAAIEGRLTGDRYFHRPDFRG